MTIKAPVIGEPDGATPLEPEEMDGLIFTHITTRGQLDELEQINIQEGLTWLKRQKNKDHLTEEFVLQLHHKLFGKVWSWAGSFRKTEKNIGSDPRYVAIELRQLLDDVRYWTENNTYEPLELAARFHHRLVKIHPFPNGNGRHARIIANALLTNVLHEKAIDWSGGQSLQKMSERRSLYIAALRTADKHDYAPLMAFIGAA